MRAQSRPCFKATLPLIRKLLVVLRRNGSAKRALRIARGERKGVKEERGGESGRGGRGDKGVTWR